MVVHTCNLSLLEVETGASEVQGNLLRSEWVWGQPRYKTLSVKYINNNKRNVWSLRLLRLPDTQCGIQKFCLPWTDLTVLSWSSPPSRWHAYPRQCPQKDTVSSPETLMGVTASREWVHDRAPRSCSWLHKVVSLHLSIALLCWVSTLQ